MSLPRAASLPLALAALAALLAPRPARAELPRVEYGYDLDRGAFVRTHDKAWELNPYAMVQLQQATVFEKGEPTSTTFSLRSAKLIFRGHIFHPSLTYHLQINAGQGRVVAENVYLRWDPDPAIGLLAGQIEVPYNRQHITPEAYTQLIDRSIVDQRFTLQRDMGAALYASDRGHRCEATLGVWNGARQSATNDDRSYLGSLRLAFNPWGPIPYREADLEDSRRPKLSLAAAGAYNPTRVVTDPTGAAAPVIIHHIAQAALEITLRYHGVSLSTEVHLRRQDPEGARGRLDYGAFGQAGVFAVPRRLELSARFSAIDGALGPKDAARELTFGATLYLRGHRFKAQADTSRLQLFDTTVDYRVRTQLEFFL